MTRTTRALCLVAAIPVAGGTAAAQPRAHERALGTAIAAVTAQTVGAHASFLIDERLGRRVVGTAGGELAAKYVATQFAAMGLEPASDGGFLQEFTVLGVTAHPSLVVGAGRGTVALQHPDDFVAWTEQPDPAVNADGEIVFVGFGSRQPDVVGVFERAAFRGKIVLMLVRSEGDGDTATGGDEALAAARRIGASGVLLVPVQPGGLNWHTIRALWSGERFPTDSAASGSLRFGAWITATAVRRVLGDAGIDFDVLIHRARLADFRPIPLAVNAAVHIRNTVRRIDAANVSARLPGADPTRSDEAVVVATRYDERGVEPTAEDSATAVGTAVMLSVANAFSRSDPRFPRSMIFLATVAGRDGVLGAREFVSDPSVPLHRIVAVIDLGTVRSGDSTELVASGAAESSLDAAWRRAAADQGLTPADPYSDAQRDTATGQHLVFARAGVPAMSLASVPGPATASAESGLSHAVQLGRLIVRLSAALATTREFPSWMEGSEFSPAGHLLRQLREGR